MPLINLLLENIHNSKRVLKVIEHFGKREGIEVLMVLK
jgi:hypothetical protein